MKRTIFVLIASLLFTIPGFCQQIFVGIKAGYGQYQLSDLKAFQKGVADKSGLIPAKLMEQFPGYFFQASSLEFQIEQFQLIGIDFTYHTTGARNALSDYSGNYRLDLHLQGRRLGVFYKDKIAGNPKTGLFVQFRGGILFTRLKTVEKLAIYPSFEEEWKLEFNGESAFFEPSFIGFRKLSESFRLEVAFGYEYELGGVLFLKSTDRKIELEHPDSRNTVRANWSGIRLSAGILYSLNYRAINKAKGG